MSLTLEDQKRIFQTIANAKDNYYVYALCNEDKIPFYIGKGKGARLTQHLDDADQVSAILKSGEENNDSQEKISYSEKIKRIIENRNNIQCVIIKWGLTEDEAFMCESALINLLDFSCGKTIEKLTNIVNGHASEAEKASRAADKTQARTLEQFRDEVAIETKDISEIPVPVAFIKINTLYEKCLNKDNSPDNQKIKEAVRAMWSIGSDVRKYGKYVFALYQQRVVGIFNVECISDPIADEWNANGLRDFPTFPEDTRQMDRWKAQFSSFAEAKEALTLDEYEIFKAQIEKECRNSKAKTKPTPGERLKHEQSKAFFILGDNVPAEIMSFYNCRLCKKDSRKYFTGQTPLLHNLNYFDLKTLSKNEKTDKKSKSAQESRSIATAKLSTVAGRKAGSEILNKLIERKSLSFCGKQWTLAEKGESIYSYLPGNRYLTFKILPASNNNVKIEFGILSEYQKEDEKQRHRDKIKELNNELARFINGKVLSYDNDSFVKGSDDTSTYFVLKPSESGSSNKSVHIEDVEAKVSEFEARLTNCGLKAKLLELCK